ncbi:hypothetical protein [Streptomyces sp. S1A1-7]|uniref:hypothetical protein n=1 Tax=Streptomyces sp. S1A1-7 TaxID=2594459 RepID=UPI0019682C0C|nr:hypothetical protein [Streptomyces sp. S1A1-7]
MTSGWRDWAREPAGFGIAKQWAELPAEHLKVALEALEPQLQREHEAQMEHMRLAVQEAEAARTHRLYLWGLITGFVLTVGMLTGAVIVGSNNQPVLAGILSGPSVIALATIFVLRRNDAKQMQMAARVHQAALNAASQSSSAPAPPSGPSLSGSV